MRHHDEDPLTAWLEAEERGDADAADAALAAVFADAPERPSPAFAERTMVRARMAGVLASPDAAPAVALAGRTTASAAAKLAALWLALLSVGTLLAASWLVTALPRMDFSLGARGFTRLLAEAWQWLASGVVFWERLAEAGSLVAKVLQVPEVAAIVVVSLGLSALAFRLLQGILQDDRKWSYAQRQ